MGDSEFEYEGDFDDVEEALIGDFPISDNADLEKMDNHELAKYLIKQSLPSEMLACLEKQNDLDKSPEGRAALQELQRYVNKNDDVEEEIEEVDDYDVDEDIKGVRAKVRQEEDSDNESEASDRRVWQDVMRDYGYQNLVDDKVGIKKISKLIRKEIDEDISKEDILEEFKAMKKDYYSGRKFGNIKSKMYGINSIKPYNHNVYNEPSLADITRDYLGPGGGKSTRSYGKRRRSRKNNTKHLTKYQQDAKFVMNHFHKTKNTDPDYSLQDAWDDFKNGDIETKRTRHRSIKAKKIVKRRSKPTRKRKSVKKGARRRRRSVKQKPVEYGPTYQSVFQDLDKLF